MTQPDQLAAQDPWLRRLARRFVSSRARADDLVQDTYVTALRSAPPDAQLRPWLFTVMRKLAWGQARGEHRRAQREAGFALLASLHALPDALRDHDVDRERLAAALASLPEPFQSTLVERYLHGRTCADIARRDNIPAGTVRWRQVRGIELLRAELAPPRRRFVFWALPFLGAGERLVARVWQSLAARLSGSKAIGLLLACAAVLYAIIGAPPQRAITAPVLEARHGMARADGGGPGAAASAQVGGELGRSRAAPRAVRDDGTFDEGVAALVADRSAADGDAERGARSESLDVDRDDCTWDPVHGRHCERAPGSSSADARCALLVQQIVAADALALGTRSGRALFNPAVLAQRALAQRLGCATARPDVGRAGGPAVGDSAAPRGSDTSPAGTPPAGCVTERFTPVTTCTVCPGATPVCPGLACRTRTIATGFTCTVCLGDAGVAFTDCPAAPSPRCRSTLSGPGMLCSTCDDQPGPAECLPAQCTPTIDGCLRCVDSKDRVAEDCSVDEDAVFGFTEMWNTGVADELGSCTERGETRFGVRTTACHYPGTQSCMAVEYPDRHCLYCSYRDGSAISDCMDARTPLPDPLADRPHDLPAPGECASEVVDRNTACTTCTRADLSATRTCQ